MPNFQKNIYYNTEISKFYWNKNPSVIVFLNKIKKIRENLTLIVGINSMHPYFNVIFQTALLSKSFVAHVAINFGIFVIFNIF